MDEAFSSEVLHAFCNLATERQQQRRCVVINQTGMTTGGIKSRAKHTEMHNCLVHIHVLTNKNAKAFTAKQFSLLVSENIFEMVLN